MRLTRFAWLLSLGICVLGLPSDVLGQGTFQNLDFESGTFIPIPGDPYGRVQWSSAMPGWTGYAGTNQINWVLHNNLFLGTAGIAILGPNYPSPAIYHGRFFVVLQSGFDPNGAAGQIVTASLAQTGQLPADAKSIQFYGSPAVNALAVTFGGQPIPLVVLGGSVTTDYLWGGDISGFAGQIGELQIRGHSRLDFIQFSPVAIPEPGSFALLSLGGGWLAWALRRARA